MEWQDISTAPKDGTDVLLWDGGERVIGHWTQDDYGQSGWSEGEMDYGDGERWAFPTMWMPLPSPPGLDRKE